MLYIGGTFASPIMGLFTPRQFKKPSEWLRAIPLVREEIHALSLQTDLDVIEHLGDWVMILWLLLKVEHHLQRDVERSLEREEEEVWYPIQMSHRLYGRVQQLLYCHPLSDEGLSQVAIDQRIREYTNH